MITKKQYTIKHGVIMDKKTDSIYEAYCISPYCESNEGKRVYLEQDRRVKDVFKVVAVNAVKRKQFLGLVKRVDLVAIPAKEEVTKEDCEKFLKQARQTRALRKKLYGSPVYWLGNC